MFAPGDSFGFFQSGLPALTWTNEAPRHMTELRQRVQTVFPRLARFSQAAAAVNNLGATEEEKKEEHEQAPMVEVKDSRGTSSILNRTGTLLVGIGEILSRNSSCRACRARRFLRFVGRLFYPCCLRERLLVRSRVTPHRKSPAHRVESLQKVTANELPSKMKDTLCISYSRRFLPVPSGLAAARSASFSSSLLWCYWFAVS